MALFLQRLWASYFRYEKIKRFGFIYDQTSAQANGLHFSKHKSWQHDRQPV